MSDKNGPMGRSDLKPCPRQCTVWPNADKLCGMVWSASAWCPPIHQLLVHQSDAVHGICAVWTCIWPYLQCEQPRQAFKRIYDAQYAHIKYTLHMWIRAQFVLASLICTAHRAAAALERLDLPLRKSVPSLRYTGIIIITR